MRILFFGTYDAARHPRVRVLQEGLRDWGDNVIECNARLEMDTATRLGFLQRPWLAPLFGMRVLALWRRLRRMAQALPPADAVVVGYMGHFDVRLARRLWPHRLIVLDHLTSAAETGADRRVGSSVVMRFLEALDKRALRAADLIVVDTEEHERSLPAKFQRRAIVVPVGAPRGWFRAPPARTTPPLRVVFFGLYTPLQGTPIIGQAIAELVDDPLHFTMIGAGQELAQTRKAAAGNPNVEWAPWVEPERLPEIVAQHDVCLGIFGTGPKALRVVPNKVFQGAAAGCAILTSDTAPQRRALADAAVYVPAGQPGALAAVLRDLGKHPDRVQALRLTAHRHARERFSPSVVVEPLRRRLRPTLMEQE